MVLATTCGASGDSWAEVRGVRVARLEAAETPNWRRGRAGGLSQSSSGRD